MILDIFAQNAHTPGGQGAGRAGAAALPPAPAAPRRRRQAVPAARRRRHPLRWRRDEARGRPPAHHAPHQPSSRPSSSELGRTRQLQRKQRDRSGLAAVTIVGYTNAGKSTLLNRAHRRRRARRGPPVRHARPDHPPARRCPAASRCCSPTPSASSAACRTAWSRRSRARSRSPPTPTTWSTSSTPAPPTRRARSTPCATVLARDRRRPRCPSCSCSTRPTWRRGEAKRLVDDHPGSVAISAVTGEGIDDFLRTLGDRLRALTDGRRARRARTTAATCSPRSTARARSSRRPTSDDGMRVRARLSDASAGRLAEFVVAPSGVRDRRRADADAGFVPPPYPYDRLDRLTPLADALDGRRSSTCRSARRATRRRRRWSTRWPTSDAERGYPPSIGTRRAARRGRRLDRAPLRRRRRPPPRSAPASAPRSSSARCRSGCACARPTATPCCTRRSPTRPTRWGRSSPAAGRSPVPLDARRSARPRRRSTPADADRALALWVNSPGNPTGALDDLGAAAAWGRAPRRAGVLRRVLRRVHLGRPAAARSSSTGSTASSPCTRCRSARTSPAPGSASTPATPSSSHYLQEVRKHVGMMVPGPAQAAGVVALDDDAHVEVQRERYRRRLERMAEVLGDWSGIDVAAARPAASTCGSPVDDGWAFAERLAARGRCARQPGRVLRSGGGGRSCASPWYNLTIGSSWSPLASRAGGA